ncbi:hypothetical protein Tco_0745202 [Tanacetum coccineum]
MEDDTAPKEQIHSSDDEDIENDHIPKASALASTYATPLENLLLAQTGDIEIFMNWFCKKQGIKELTQKDLEGPTFEIVKVFHPNVIHLQYQKEECHKLLTDKVDDAIISYNVSKLLPLGGQPGQIEEECKYDIAAMYGISHWWFQRQRFYIDRHTFEGDRRAVRTHMRILSVVRIEVFSLYGYDYMKTIVLRRVDLNEYIIAERDFKYLYPSDFEDLQRVKDFQLGIESYQTQPNLTKPRWDATGFEFNHDFTIIDSPRAVTFRDKYEVKMIMRFNEIHKFSDDTLQQIDEALDYRVKEFKSYKDDKVRYSFPRSRQSQRDLPSDNPLVSVDVLRAIGSLPRPVHQWYSLGSPTWKGSDVRGVKGEMKERDNEQ